MPVAPDELGAGGVVVRRRPAHELVSARERRLAPRARGDAQAAVERRHHQHPATGVVALAALAPRQQRARKPLPELLVQVVAAQRHAVERVGDRVHRQRHRLRIALVLLRHGVGDDRLQPGVVVRLERRAEGRDLVGGHHCGRGPCVVERDDGAVLVDGAVEPADRQLGAAREQRRRRRAGRRVLHRPGAQHVHRCARPAREQLVHSAHGSGAHRGLR